MSHTGTAPLQMFENLKCRKSR